MGSIPALGAVGSGGQVLPRPSVFRWARDLCVEFACSPSVHKTPNSTLSYQSLTKMDGSLHLVPGRLKAVLEEGTIRDGEMQKTKIRGSLSSSYYTPQLS